jgi:mono/diheme cytochrome c family protein
VLILAGTFAVRAGGAESKGAPRDAESVALGCVLYATHCSACHGTCGKGDGHAGYVLPKRPKDLTDSSYADDSDEELLETITYGKRSMPKYKKMLTETQRLQVIAYLRTMIVKVEKSDSKPAQPSGGNGK